MKKVGLVLSGGGARGMAHIGALKVFDDLGIKFSAISGCSIGAVIGAFYAAGKSGQEIENFVLNNKIYRNFDFSFSTLGVKNIAKLEKIMLDFIGVDSFHKLNTPLYINATNISKGKELVFKNGKLMEAIRASISVPGVFSPIRIKEEYHIDGGVLNEVPFSILPEEIDHYIIVDVSPYQGLGDKQRINIVDVLQASIKIMQKQIFWEKLKIGAPCI